MELPPNHDRLASDHAKNAILIFVLVGVVLLLLSPKAHFLSVRAMIFFVGGIFAASLASALSYLVGLKLANFGARRLDMRRLPLVAHTFQLLTLAFDVGVACGVFWIVFHWW